MPPDRIGDPGPPATAQGAGRPKSIPGVAGVQIPTAELRPRLLGRVYVPGPDDPPWAGEIIRRPRVT